MKIHMRETDDWIAVYKDGKCVWSTHSCTIEDGLTALGIPYTSEWKDGEDEFDDMSDWFVDELDGEGEGLDLPETE